MMLGIKFKLVYNSIPMMKYNGHCVLYGGSYRNGEGYGKGYDEGNGNGEGYGAMI